MSDCFDATTVIACHNGQPAVVHYVHDHMGRPKVLITDVSGAVIPGATSANTTVGSCPVVASSQTVFGGGVNIAEGTFSATHDPNAIGPSWSWTPTVGSELQSVTVTALEAGFPASGNRVRVRFGATGGEVWLVKGQSFTWSVAQHSANIAEFLDPGLDVRCFGNSAANVVWTEQ